MPPFREDQILIIAPGSETTLAQLGLPESFTPARFRFRSRMFPAPKEGEFEAVKIRRRRQTAQPAAPTNGADVNSAEANGASTESTYDDEWEEDRISEEGAIWPVKAGRITDWPAFYALMSHVHNTVNPPFHTPVVLVTEPVWTPKDREKLTQFFFEKFKVPAFTLVDSAIASLYAYGVPTATVIDVGFDKADVTCIADFVLHEIGRAVAVPDCGGEAMTKRLEEVLHSRTGFTRAVCEQLKKSPICEILPRDVELPTSENTGSNTAGNPAAAASTGQDGAAPGQRKPSIHGELPRGPGPDTEVGDEKNLKDDDGVLDIAGIVTGGNMAEYLAQKEKEKAEKKLQKKGTDVQQTNQQKPARLPNSRRVKNTFLYEDLALHDAVKKAGIANEGMADMQTALDESGAEPHPASDRPAEGTTNGDTADVAAASGGLRREIEVGPERFQAATGGMLDRLADAIYRTVLSCSDITKRADLWDSLILVGNGARVRGFQEALLHTLHSKYIISPSSATIFTSELPSALTTPVATGTNTPQPLIPGQQMQHSSGVNPLLIAATTAQTPGLQHSASVMGQAQGFHAHSSHAQTPTSIRLAKIPEYFPEWKDFGFDEAQFLGAQVAAKILFIVDGGASKGYLSRTDYNDQGPTGIHEVYM